MPEKLGCSTSIFDAPEPVDQLLPQTPPSTIPSHSLHFVAGLFIYIFMCILLYSGSKKKSNISGIVAGHRFAGTPP